MDVHLRIPSRFSDVAAIVHETRRLMPGQIPQDEVARMEIGLHEVLNNIIEHGYGGKPDQIIDFWACRRRGRLMLLIEDSGLPHPAPSPQPEEIVDIEQMSERGRGLWLIQQCFASVRYRVRKNRNQTILILREGPYP